MKKIIVKLMLGYVLIISPYSFAQNDSNTDPVTQIGPDTTYHPATGTIYTITEADLQWPNHTTKYTVYYLDGSVQYYCTYEYSGSTLTKINYFDGNDRQYAYGIYTANYLPGTDYRHYASDGTLISLTRFTRDWVSQEFVAYTVGENVVYRIYYTINSSGYITREQYFNEKDELYGEGVWTFRISDSVTIYTYQQLDSVSFLNPVTNESYNAYEIFYHNYFKDSLKVYSNGIRPENAVYKNIYNYDTNGYMIQDKYFKDDKMMFVGEYKFDRSNFTTTYTYSSPSEGILFQTVYDFMGANLKKENYRYGALESIITYRYDQYGNYERVTKNDPYGNLISYETYSYYEPYSILKELAVFDNRDVETTTTTFDIYGNKTAQTNSISRNTRMNRPQNSSAKQTTLQLFDIRGRLISKSSMNSQKNNLVPGVYIHSNNECKVHNKATILNKR